MGIRVSEEEEYDGVDISGMRYGSLSGIHQGRDLGLTAMGPGGIARPFFCVLTYAISSIPEADMFCHIYRSNHKVDTYLYLVDKDDFSVVPEDLLRVFGPPEFSFSFDLTEERKLAREDSAEVLQNLKATRVITCSCRTISWSSRCSPARD